jgi:Family of unknown function (DUF5681)
MDTPYTVGYGKPPKKNQFKKGQSGNPRGRAVNRFAKSAKEPLSFENALIAELKSRITVTKNGRSKKITKLQAFATSMVTRALQGDRAAQRFLLAQLPKLPHDAFIEDGDGIYTIRLNEAQMKAQKVALEFLAKDLDSYEIPEDDQDGSTPRDEHHSAKPRDRT